MSEAALALALARALPLCLVLPLPGVAARLALALVLACAAPSSSVPGGSLPLELGRGLALGLGLALPVLAARAAARALGLVAARAEQAFDWLVGALAWCVFCALGGATMLCTAYLRSYAAWPVGAAPAVDHAARASLALAGAAAFGLFARLALPGLLALALVELCAGLLWRLEDAARLAIGAPRLAAGLRPVVALLLLSGSLAALWIGIGSTLTPR